MLWIGYFSSLGSVTMTKVILDTDRKRGGMNLLNDYTFFCSNNGGHYICFARCVNTVLALKHSDWRNNYYFEAQDQVGTDENQYPFHEKMLRYCI